MSRNKLIEVKQEQLSKLTSFAQEAIKVFQEAGKYKLYWDPSTMALYIGVDYVNAHWIGHAKLKGKRNDKR